MSPNVSVIYAFKWSDNVMPRSHIHGSPCWFHNGLNFTDVPGNASFPSLIRMHSGEATTYDYGCITESYGPVQIATNDARSYPWLNRRSFRECVTWAQGVVMVGRLKCRTRQVFGDRKSK